MIICLGKSTYARCGIIVNVTPLEPGWEVLLHLNFVTTPLPAKIYQTGCSNLWSRGMKNLKFLTQKEKVSI